MTTEIESILTQSAEKNVQALAQHAQHIKQVVAELGAWFEPPNTYYLRDARDVFVAYGLPTITRRLMRAGLSAKKGPTGMSEVDDAIDEIQYSRVVEWAGKIAGWERGDRTLSTGKRVLNTADMAAVEPVPGECAPVHTFLKALFNDPDYDQMPVVYGWLQWAYRQYRIRQHLPGQILVLSGAVNAGKTIFVELCSYMFAGYSTSFTNPIKFLSGQVHFNGEWAECAILAADDVPGLTHRQREHLTGEFKNKFFSTAYDITAKGKPTIMLRPYQRGMWAGNDKAEDLEATPFTRGGTDDKITILRCYPGGVLPGCTQQGDMMRHLEPYVPGFLHWLENEFVIPESLRCTRMGVKAWHHPGLMAELKANTPEGNILELLDDALWRDDATDEDSPSRIVFSGGDAGQTATGSAADFLSFAMNHWDMAVQKQAGSIIRSTYMMGRRLTRLAEEVPHRVTCLGVTPAGVKQYEIRHPGGG